MPNKNRTAVAWNGSRHVPCERVTEIVRLVLTDLGPTDEFTLHRAAMLVASDRFRELMASVGQHKRPRIQTLGLHPWRLTLGLLEAESVITLVGDPAGCRTATVVEPVTPDPVDRRRLDETKLAMEHLSRKTTIPLV